jgi:hypothetical protein
MSCSPDLAPLPAGPRSLRAHGTLQGHQLAAQAGQHRLCPGAAQCRLDARSRPGLAHRVGGRGVLPGRSVVQEQDRQQGRPGRGSARLQGRRPQGGHLFQSIPGSAWSARRATGCPSGVRQDRGPRRPRRRDAPARPSTVGLRFLRNGRPRPWTTTSPAPDTAPRLRWPRTSTSTDPRQTHVSPRIASSAVAGKPLAHNGTRVAQGCANAPGEAGSR